MAMMGFFELMMLLSLPMGGGNELLDMVTTKDYWQSQGVEVSLEAMTAELRTGKVPDISRLVAKLGDEDFKVRDAATRKIRSFGPGVVPQLKKAAASGDAEIAGRARALIQVLDRGKKASAARRLMAIRALGELKKREALPVLEKLLTSKEPFIAEYAKQAVASINGKPYTRPRPTLKELDEDLAILPANCGLVGQTSLYLPSTFQLDKILDGLPPFFPANKKKEIVDRVRKEMLRVVGLVGNVRVDAITMGLADHVGQRDGFVVFVFRGQYDRQAMASLLAMKQLRMKQSKVNDVTVLSADGQVHLLFVSDQRLVFIGGPRQNALTPEKMLAYIKSKKNTLPTNAGMMVMIKKVDRKNTLWAVTNMPPKYKLDPPFSTFREVALTVGRDKKALVGKLVARGDDEEKVGQVVGMMDAQIKEVIAQGKKQAGLLPMLKPAIDVLESIKHKTDDKTVTITARVEDAANLLTLPATVGFFAFRGIAAAPPPPVRNPKRPAPEKDDKKEAAPK